MNQSLPAISRFTWTTVTYFHFALIAVSGLILLGLLNLWDFTPFQWYVFMHTGSQSEWRVIAFQLAWIVLPGLVGFVLLRSWLGWMKGHGWVWAAVPIILLILPFIPGIGVAYGGASRSFYLLNIHIYAGIWAVLAALPTLAAWLSEPATGRSKVFQVCWFVAINLLLALQPNLPMLVLFNAVTLTMVVVSRVDNRWKTAAVLVLVMVGISALGVVVDGRSISQFRAMSDHRQEGRGIGYQARMSIEDIRSGGQFGQGLGSFPRMVDGQSSHVLPHTVTTHMLQITGRNLGLLGIGLVLLLLTTLFWSAWNTAASRQDRFVRMLGMGALAFLAFQALFSILRTLNLLPFMPAHAIPFLAYGETTLAAFIALALMFPGSRNVLSRKTSSLRLETMEAPTPSFRIAL